MHSHVSRKLNRNKKVLKFKKKTQEKYFCHSSFCRAIKKKAWNDFAYPKWLWERVIHQHKRLGPSGLARCNVYSVHSALDCKTSHIHYRDCNWTRSLKRLSLHSIVTFHKHGGDGWGRETHSHTHTHCRYNLNARHSFLWHVLTKAILVAVSFPQPVSVYISNRENVPLFTQHTIVGLKEEVAGVYVYKCLLNEH